MALRNRSTITEFILTGLSDDPHIQALLFALFLVIYLLTVMGNLTMLLVIRADSHLHTPMYFFLSAAFHGPLPVPCRPLASSHLSRSGSSSLLTISPPAINLQ